MNKNPIIKILVMSLQHSNTYIEFTRLNGLTRGFYVHHDKDYGDCIRLDDIIKQATKVMISVLPSSIMLRVYFERES